MAQAEMCGGNSTKSTIIAILSASWPLSLKEIAVRVERDGGKSISYQAVHKALKQMENNGIINYRNKKYQLSVEWIKQIKQQFSKIEANYLADKSTQEEEAHQNIFFRTLYDVDSFLINWLIQQVSSKKQKETICLQWSHFWIPLFISRGEYAKLKEIGKFAELYAVTKSDTLVDKWCQDFWNKGGMKTKTNIGSTSTADLIICGGYIVEVYYPQEIRRRVDSFFENTKDATKIDLDELFHSLFEAKTHIPVTINKNTLLAEQMKKQIKSYFK